MDKTYGQSKWTIDFLFVHQLSPLILSINPVHYTSIQRSSFSVLRFITGVAHV